LPQRTLTVLTLTLNINSSLSSTVIVLTSITSFSAVSYKHHHRLFLLPYGSDSSYSGGLATRLTMMQPRAANVTCRWLKTASPQNTLFYLSIFFSPPSDFPAPLIYFLTLVRYQIFYVTYIALHYNAKMIRFYG